MANYNQFLNDFCKNYYNNLNSNEGIIIEALVDFYGEEHIDKIIDTIDSINIVVFFPSSTEKICTKDIPKLMYEEFIDNTYQIYSLLELAPPTKISCLGISDATKGKIDNPIASGVYNSDDELIDEQLEAIFGKTRLFNYDYANNALYNFSSYSESKQKKIVKKVFKSDVITPEILEKIKSVKTYMDYLKIKTGGNKKYSAAATFYNHYKKYKDNPKLIKRIVCSNTKMIPPNLESLTDDPSMFALPEEFYIAMPLFLSNDNFFIHELNHALTVSIIALTGDDDDTLYLVEKAGLDTIHAQKTLDDAQNEFYKHILHELLNERMTQDIVKIMHDYGGNIFDESATYDIPVKIPYHIMLPLIEDFYQEHKEVIKEASISENQKLLYSQIDKKALQDFSEFINKTYIEILNSDETELTQEQLDTAAYYTERLQRKPHTEVSSEDYLILLEMDGHKVTYLHHHDDDNQPKALAKAKKKK